MTDFVLDNSVSMRWLLESKKASDQKYAEIVLKSMVETDARVPNLWYLEATNVLLEAERRCAVAAGEIERFISQLENLPLHVDSLTSHQSFNRIMAHKRWQATGKNTQSTQWRNSQPLSKEGFSLQIENNGYKMQG